MHRFSSRSDESDDLTALRDARDRGPRLRVARAVQHAG